MARVTFLRSWVGTVAGSIRRFDKGDVFEIPDADVARLAKAGHVTLPAASPSPAPVVKEKAAPKASSKKTEAPAVIPQVPEKGETE